VGLKIAAASVYKTGQAMLQLYNGSGREISWTWIMSDGGSTKFQSPQPDTYYIKISPSISFSLTASEQ
jgi:hypothetical protein